MHQVKPRQKAKHRWLSCLQSHSLQTGDSFKYFPLNSFRILVSQAEGCREMQQGRFKFLVMHWGRQGWVRKGKPNSRLPCTTYNMGSLWPLLNPKPNWAHPHYSFTGSDLPLFQMEDVSLAQMGLRSVENRT